MNTDAPTPTVPSLPHRRLTWRPLAMALAVVLTLVAAGLWLHFQRLHQADTSPPPEAAPWALQTGTVGRGSVGDGVQTVATIEATNAITLAPQIQGTVLATGPRAGVAVRRGELLVRIDARAVASNVAALAQQRIAAQVDADYAARQQARIDALLAEGGVSQSQADQARAATVAALARTRSLGDQIDALRVNLGYADIRAPQDAIVAQRLVEVGDVASPGKPVYLLTAGKGAVVRVNLAVGQLAGLRRGDTLELRQGNERTRLAITRIVPMVNAAGLGSVQADAASTPFGLPSGSVVAATVFTQAGATALTVPTAALVGQGATAHVLVLVPAAAAGALGHLRSVPVQVLQQASDMAAVKGALNVGDRVVIGHTAVLAQLRDGDAALTAAGAGAGP